MPTMEELQAIAQRYGVSVPDLAAMVPELSQMQQAYAEQPAVQVQQAPVAPETPEITVQPEARRQFAPIDLQSMYEAYEGQPTVYSQQIEQARAANAAQQKQLEDAIRAAAGKSSNTGPSKSELYFKLAQAFLTPGKTGDFTEGLAGAAGVGADYRGQQRAARKEQEQRELTTNLELAKLKSGQSKEDLTTLRALDAGERQDRRVVQGKLLEQYIASGKPQSDAGKEAQDAGLQFGTPEFNKFVTDRIKQKMETGELYKQAMLGIAQGNLALRQQKAGEMTAHEMDLLIESQDQTASANSAKQNLKKAIALNDSIFGSDATSMAQRKAIEFADPKNSKLKNTEEFENIVMTQAASQLKAIFGGNPTEGERAILMQLQGLMSKNPAARKTILENAFAAADAREKRAARRAKEIKSGTMRMRSEDEPEDVIDGVAQ